MAKKSEETYIVAATKPWNRRVFETVIRRYPGKWIFVDERERLTPAFVRSLEPRWIFFLHWSWRVPEEITKQFECVCFHMTDVPFGRGGSPLQNLIMRGLRETRLSALKMVRDMDAGPVYLKEPLSLEGGAEEIYVRAARLAADMIARILRERPVPVEQSGDPVVFARRTPGQSEIPTKLSLDGLYDFIRMLDAEGYPRAFLVHRGFRFEIRRASLYDGRIQAEVTIVPEEQE